MLISNPLEYWSTGGRSDQDAVVEYGKDQSEGFFASWQHDAAVPGYFNPVPSPIT